VSGNVFVGIKTRIIQYKEAMEVGNTGSSLVRRLGKDE